MVGLSVLVGVAAVVWPLVLIATGSYAHKALQLPHASRVCFDERQGPSAPEQCFTSLPACESGSSGAPLVPWGQGIPGERPLSPLSLVTHQVRSHHHAAGTELSEYLGGCPVANRSYSLDQLLVTGCAVETTDWRLQMLRGAKQSIEVSGNFGGGEILERTFEAIEGALRDSAQCVAHVMFSDDLLDETNRATISRLEAAYGSRFHFLETHRYPNPIVTSVENHVKLTVVDEHCYIAGGTGIADNLVTRGIEVPEGKEQPRFVERLVAKAVRDTDLVGCGQLARSLRQQYFELWKVFEEHEGKQPSGDRYRALSPRLPRIDLPAFSFSEKALDGVPIRATTSGPEQRINQCTREVAQMIAGAKESVSIGHMHINMPGPVKQALLAHGDGIDVKVVTNNLGDFATLSGSAQRLWTASYLDDEVELLKANPKATLGHYLVDSTVYHKKVIVIDHRYLLIGSWNLGEKSHQSDYELLLTVDSPALAKQVEEALDDDLTRCHKVGLEEAESNYSRFMAALAAVSSLHVA